MAVPPPADRRRLQAALNKLPVEDRQWQARAQQGFDAAHFQVDWDAR